MNGVIGKAFLALWGILVGYWLISALRVKAAKARQSIVSRLAYQLPLITACILLFNSSLPWGVLGERFLPPNPIIPVLGLVLTAFGIAFAIWARYILGRNWSSAVTIKEQHELIRSGPYARVRHPIYTGLLLAFLGNGMAITQWRALIGIALIWISFYTKARIEEKMLSQEFGAAFEEHRRHTGFFFPRLSS